MEHLAKHGETAWDRMPCKVSRQKVSVTNRTWRPMVMAGLISAEFKETRHRSGLDWHFAITEAGRTALARCGGASNNNTKRLEAKSE